MTADGTLIELIFEPNCADSADNHGQKLQWPITMFILGNDNCKIRYHLIGFPGSSHDNRVWKWGKIYKERSKLFSPFQYIIMDTAFEPCGCVVSAMKRDEGNGNSDAQLFNHVIAKSRVRSEHLNEIIKSRFSGAMRKIRTIITDKKESLKEILILIECAVILHNMLLDSGDSKDDDGVEDE